MSHLLLFDPYATGHHAEHIRHIFWGWAARSAQGTGEERLTAAVAPELLADHPDLRHVADEVGARLIEIQEVETLGNSLLAAGIWHRRVVARYVEQVCPTHALLLYLDHAQLALATGLRFPFAVSLSGILFRPSFHYGQFEAKAPPLAERIKRFRKRLVLQYALRNPHLDTVFTLDPSAAPAMQRLAPERVHTVALPDPVDPTSLRPTTARDEVRRSFGVEPGRTMALLFGALSPRKGALEVVESLRFLSDKAARQLCVLMVGPVHPDLRHQLLAESERVQSSVQLLLHDTFVPDDQVQDLIGAADLVLVPYQRHVGSSGVLIRAAAAARPVLGQDYGIVGHQIITQQLGQTVDTTRPEAIARALENFLVSPNEGFNAMKALAFASQNTVEAYLDVMFRHLHRPKYPPTG